MNTSKKGPSCEVADPGSLHDSVVEFPPDEEERVKQVLRELDALRGAPAQPNSALDAEAWPRVFREFVSVLASHPDVFDADSLNCLLGALHAEQRLPSWFDHGRYAVPAEMAEADFGYELSYGDALGTVLAIIAADRGRYDVACIKGITRAFRELIGEPPLRVVSGESPHEIAHPTDGGA